MMTVSLFDLCRSNLSLLGDPYWGGQRFENLGKETGILLSFNASKGWAIEKFEGVCGFFKWILRYFGFYKSTHLLTVRNQIMEELKEEHPFIPWRLAAKINFCWLKKQGIGDPIQHLPVNEAQAEVNAPPDQKAIRFKKGALLTIVEGNISEQFDVSTIVNATDELCLDGSIENALTHRNADDVHINSDTKRKIYEECLRLPVVNRTVRCPMGEARITGSGNLKDQGIKRIIHTAIPTYSLLATKKDFEAYYENSFELARENGIRSIAFPSFSRENPEYDFSAIESYLNEHSKDFNQVKIVYFDPYSFDQARKAWDEKFLVGT